MRIESTHNWLRRINLLAKRAGERSAGNLHAPFDVAGNGNQLTVRLVRHSQRKRRATDRSDLRSMAPFLDPTRPNANQGSALPCLARIRLNGVGPLPDCDSCDARGLRMTPVVWRWVAMTSHRKQRQQRRAT